MIISIFNFLLCNIALSSAILFTALITVEVIIINAICAITVSKIIKIKKFNENNFLYKVTKTNMNFYKKIGIKTWKDKIPDLGRLGGFKKDKIEKPNDIEYLNKYYYEINNGIMVHFVSLFAVFIALFIPPYWYLAIKIPVILVSCFLNLLPIFVLRYNKYKLQQIIAFKTKDKNNKDIANE